MNKLWIFVGLLLLISIGSAGVAPCPLQSKIGSIISGIFQTYLARITVAQSLSLVSLVPNVDAQCYNYSLPY